ncbi:unnamed protein product [Ectocarpus sp. 4 AP-2014]|uniref:EsV-1-194 n=1 Tax=Ectocarpus siliculosus virus 1 (isolate New Zealand/Kaikoura/1988) TaxID=654926 RepID=Q8QN95_ESV1K|nr:EsV-1-194 [Ectocarpus siliculosus virus 1]AAK14608.1 EsV-1-194 [Ectocarpus siliculosus virus 1]
MKEELPLRCSEVYRKVTRYCSTEDTTQVGVVDVGAFVNKYNIDSLIRNRDLKLSKDDMEDLKSRIVLKLGEVASNRGCESGTVVCTSQKIEVDEAAKLVLRDVVREEIEGVQSGSDNDTPINDVKRELLSYDIYNTAP